MILQANWVGSWRRSWGFCTVTSWSFDLARAWYPNHVVLVLGNKGGGSSSHARTSYTGPMDRVKEASGFDFEYSSNIQLSLQFFLFSTPMFNPKANMNIIILYQPRIAICMCNSLKCRFKHPLPYMTSHGDLSTSNCTPISIAILLIRCLMYLINVRSF